MVENVLLITIDSLRYDRFLSLADADTSTLAELSASGVSFTRAFATGPGTTPSFPALLTGTLPLSYDGLGPLSPDRPRLSENLRQAGLQTAAFQCNPFLSTHFNYDAGFDEFEDYQNPLMGIATKIFPRGIEINNPRLRRLDDLLRITDLIKKTYSLVKGKPRPYVSADVITDDAIAWLSQTDSPFFCWAQYMDVHHPCYPPQKYRDRHDVGDVSQSDVSEWYSALLRDPSALTEDDIARLERLYEAATEYTDDQVGRIVGQLKESGRYEETLILVTSDHGELFGDYDKYGKPERMYDELLHVPLVVLNGPEYLSVATDDLVSLLDVPPMIHDALGIEVPDSYTGRIPGKDDPRSSILAEHEVEGDVIVGARSDGWLYEADEITGENRLFDVSDETVERVDSETSAAASVRDPVVERLEEFEVDANYLNSDVEDDVEGRLEDLGYLE